MQGGPGPPCDPPATLPATIADSTTAAWLAHRLKGRCLGSGARGLAARCAALELACRGANRPSLEAYVGIATDVTTTTRTLRAYLTRLPQ